MCPRKVGHGGELAEAGLPPSHDLFKLQSRNIFLLGSHRDVLSPALLGCIPSDISKGREGVSAMGCLPSELS